MKKLFLVFISITILIGCKQLSSEEVVVNLKKSGKLDSEFNNDGYTLDKSPKDIIFGASRLQTIIDRYPKIDVSSQEKFFVVNFKESVSIDYVKYFFEKMNLSPASTAELIAFYEQNGSNIPLLKKIISLDDELVRVPSGNFYNWSGGYLFINKNLEEFYCETFVVETTSESGSLREKYNTVLEKDFSFLVKLK